MSSRWTAQARRSWPVALVVGVALIAGLLAGPPAGRGVSLDPRSTEPAGTRGLVLLLDELGADVQVQATPPGPDDPAGVALLLTDRLDDDERGALQDWVRNTGGTLVVTDVASPLVPDVAGGTGIGFLDVTLPRSCDLPALDGVARVAAPGGMVFETPGDAVGCFPRGDGHFLVASEEGSGAVVALGGPTGLVNRELANADNSVLAAALLVPEPGTLVTVVEPARPGEGDATLTDLIPDPVRFALIQLAIAFGIVVAWRARRLGRPVSEPQPVQIAGSELVTAVGNLLQQSRARAQAAQLLRDDLRRSLTDRLGLPPASDPRDVVDAAVHRTRVDRDQLTAVLTGDPPPDDAALVSLAQHVERIRADVLAGPPPHEPADQGAARG